MMTYLNVLKKKLLNKYVKMCIYYYSQGSKNHRVFAKILSIKETISETISIKIKKIPNWCIINKRTIDLGEICFVFWCDNDRIFFDKKSPVGLELFNLLIKENPGELF